MSDELLALSPLDGRYLGETGALRDYFSEFAYIRGRVRVEIAYLIALARPAGLVRPLTPPELTLLQAQADSFSLDDAQQSKDFERITRHDVKAVESFLREKLAPSSLADLLEFLHFGLTSEDVNNVAQAIALRDSRDKVIQPALERILEGLAGLVQEYRSAPMLARTHGQPAVPTTFGKEIAVFHARLTNQLAILSSHRFEAKLNGAVGNFNAAASAAPQIDWIAFSEEFLRGLDLEPNQVTTQILPYDNWVEYFNALHRINSILVDFAQDMWRYISDGHVRLRAIAAEAGSSTMPQKVNPIDFENAEGNLGIANALLEEYARKLPVSRLQRDLSDSTVRRTFGVALGHSLAAYVGLTRGLERIEADESRMKAELEAHWEVIAEGAQTILRAAGIPNAYESLKSLTRGRDFTQNSYGEWLKDLDVEESVKSKLRALSPLTYVGLAEKIADMSLRGAAAGRVTAKRRTETKREKGSRK